MSGAAGTKPPSDADAEVCFGFFSVIHIANSYQPAVRFESTLGLRTYVLNRPKKLNALNDEMLNLLRPKIEVYAISFYSELKFPDPRELRNGTTLSLLRL
jgi:3-hydroxyisobutyryl-CoA hydrolase